MKKFNSFLKEKLEEYIVYRKKNGYLMLETDLRSSLRKLDRYVNEKQSNYNSFTPLYFLQYRNQLNLDQGSVDKAIGEFRGFFQFLVRQGICDENPLQDIPNYGRKIFIPFIFSPEETEKLLRAVQQNIRNTQAYFFHDMALYLAMVLLAKCGLRMSEPLNLSKTHYRAEEGTISIEKTKFNKNRLIPIPKAVQIDLNNYIVLKNSVPKFKNSPYLLVSSIGERLDKRGIYNKFYQAVKDIGIIQKKKIIADTSFGAPLPHSLRHSFAINTLKRIKQWGKSPQEALPVLSAYMGHTNYEYTSQYLKVVDAEQREGLFHFALSRLKHL